MYAMQVSSVLRNITLVTSRVSPREQHCDEHRRGAIPRDDKIQKTIYEHQIEAQDAAFKKAEREVMKTTLLTEGIIL